MKRKKTPRVLEGKRGDLGERRLEIFSDRDVLVPISMPVSNRILGWGLNRAVYGCEMRWS